MNTENRLYKVDNRVYFGTREKQVHNQRGRLYVCVGKRQIHIDNIPVLPEENDPVFEYIFNGGFRTYPCYAMDYWIMRWRIKKKISIIQYKEKFIN